MSSPYTASGKNGISVADAKYYINSIDTGAISDQISHYTTVANSLSSLSTQIGKISSNLQSTWTGAAATAAATQFGAVSGQAAEMATTLSEQVVPALQNAHSGAKAAQAAIKNVQDEITLIQLDVCTTSNPSGITNIPAAVPSLATAAPKTVAPTSTMTTAEAESYNTKQRTAAANAMNSVAKPYSASSTTFTNIATGLSSDISTSPPPPTSAFTLTPSPTGGSGTSGAARNYQSTVGSGGTSGTTKSPSGTTKVQDFTPPASPPPGAQPTSPPTIAPPPPPAVILPISPPVLTSPPASPPEGDPPAGEPPVGSDPTGGNPGGVDPALGVFGEGGLPGGTGSKLVSGSAGFGEGSLAGATGSGVVPGRTSFGDPTSAGLGTSVVGSAVVGTGTGQGDQSSVGMMGGGMPGGGAGGVGGGSQGSDPSSSYLRGRYLGNDETTENVPSQWRNPAIGGSEGVLIGGQPAEASRVTSVYAGAQDGLGNPVGRMGGGFGGGRGSGDESDESGSRPGYLKEDPQWWTPEGSYVPPVVE